MSNSNNELVVLDDKIKQLKAKRKELERKQKDKFSTLIFKALKDPNFSKDFIEFLEKNNKTEASNIIRQLVQG